MNASDLIAENNRLKAILNESRITAEKLKDILSNEDSLIVKLLDNLPFVVFINDFEKCLWVNKACYNMMGYTPKEWIEQTPEEFYNKFHQEDIKELFTKEFDEFRQDKDFSENYLVGEYRMLNKNNEYRWVMSSYSPLEFDENGELLLSFGTAIDITERKNSEEQVKELNSILEKVFKKEMEVMNKQEKALQAEMNVVRKELEQTTKYICERNETLQNLKQSLLLEITKINYNSKLSKIVANSIDSIIDESSSWSVLSNQFDKAYPLFFSKVSSVAPDLSIEEKKLCALIKLEIKNRDISKMLNMNENIIETSKIRIKEKLNIDERKSLISELKKM